MRTVLAMLAVTAMKTGVCIAGVRPDAPASWIRPVREFGSVLLGDITYPSASGQSAPGAADRRVMRPFDLVELTLGHARHDPPHVEDYTCDFARARPHLAGTVPEAERATLLAGAAASPSAVWGEATRSLGTLAVDELSATFTRDTYTGKYEARVAFPGLPTGVASLPCTDLKWRALGRALLASHGHTSGSEVTTLTLTTNRLNEALGAPRDWWMVMGTARAYNGHTWPLIVGVHTLPDYEASVDYATL